MDGGGDQTTLDDISRRHNFSYEKKMLKSVEWLRLADSVKAGEEEIYQSSEPQQVVNIFRDENACPDDIDEAGEKVLIALYGRKKSEETRDSLIFRLFQKSLVKNNFILVFLPPTTAAAREHSLRAYLQVQHWSGFAKRPLDWCWKETQSPPTRNQLLQPFFL
ncbi:hypothetical protein AVEN_146957-1 [Araneus ventricosus]|uniref:Uncharacterized protein n=1 Tax=Araneus ventricosus TaxID=182803 RepID=A0A4Y2U168_ARAVE|nr:hypothetical protein AVEN_146957-1 [Araneus ventricosus]